MKQPKTFIINTMEYSRGRKVVLRALTALSVVRCLSMIKDTAKDPDTRYQLQQVIDLIHDSNPTI